MQVKGNTVRVGAGEGERYRSLSVLRENTGEVMIDDRSLILAPAVDHDKAQTLITQKLDAKKKATGAEVC